VEEQVSAVEVFPLSGKVEVRVKWRLGHQGCGWWLQGMLFILPGVVGYDCIGLKRV